jgi:NTE family protein
MSFIQKTFKKLTNSFFLILILLSGAVLSAQDRPKIGLVLSGGGARGLAHAPTLKMIDSLQIPIDYIAGTSMGGIMGALYSIGYSGKELERLALDLDWNEMFTDQPTRINRPYLQKMDDGKFQLELGLKEFTPTMPGGLIEGQKISILLSGLTTKKIIGQDFSKFPISYKCVAIDLISGREVILDKGPLAKAMRATMSIPTVFSPLEWGDSLLIDGGILNNFPADVLKKMGAEIIIGVNVGSTLKKKKELKDIIALLEQTMTLTDYSKLQDNKKLCELVITPDLTGLTAASFDKESVQKIIYRGKQAAAANLKKLKDLITPYRLSGCEESNMSITRKAEKTVNKKWRIHGITVTGNESMSVPSILDHLDIKPGDIFNRAALEKSISRIYSLGFFDRISYEIKQKKENFISLNIIVKEKPFRKLRIGFRYDNYYKLVAIVGLQSTHPIYSGFRTDMSLQFAGLFNFDYSLSYPSRTLNLPLIPYIRFNTKNVPIDVYEWSNGEVVSNYSDIGTTVGAGFALRFHNSGGLITELNLEWTDVKSTIFGQDSTAFPVWKNKLRHIRIHYVLDMLDDVFLPRKGIKLDVLYQASLKDLGSELNYHQVEIQGDLYHQLSRRNGMHIQGFYSNSLDDLPLYKYSKKGGPSSFVGMRNDQLLGNKIGYARLGYRYEYKRDIFFKLIGNIGRRGKIPNFLINNDDYIFGYGAGVKFLSIIGPLELTISRGSQGLNNPQKMEWRSYFQIGAYF